MFNYEGSKEIERQALSSAAAQLAISFARDETAEEPLLQTRLEEEFGEGAVTADPTSVLTEREKAELPGAEFIVRALAAMMWQRAKQAIADDISLQRRSEVRRIQEHRRSHGR